MKKLFDQNSSWTGGGYDKRLIWPYGYLNVICQFSSPGGSKEDVHAVTLELEIYESD